MPFRSAISCLALVVCALATATTNGYSMRSLARYKPYCYVENGFDYEGNDIKNVPSVPVEQCCSECNKVDNCNFWSWSDFNNGTCWLKSARGRIIVNAKVKSSPLYEGYHTMCEVAQDVDFVGNDIASVPSASVDGCCDLCHNHLGCRAYSWSNHLGGTCWLKSSKGQAIVSKGVKSAQAYPMPVYEPVCALINGVDYPGYDVANAPSASPTGCCTLCSKMTNCRLFSWTNQSGGTCYFKSRTPRAVPRAGVVSSIMVTNPTCDIESGVDYTGNDIANVPSTDPARCCDLCYENPDCKAYTWSDHQGGTCWLKSAKTKTVANAKTISGTTVQ